MGTWNVKPVLLPSANILANPVATDEVWPPASINVTNAKHCFSVCECVWFCGSLCTFLSTLAVRISADVSHRIFSFAVFSSSLSAAWREGPRPAEEPPLFTSTCQTSAAWLPSAAQSQCAQICVCARVLHVLCLMHFQAAVGAFTYFINDVFSCQSTFI